MKYKSLLIKIKNSNPKVLLSKFISKLLFLFADRFNYLIDLYFGSYKYDNKIKIENVSAKINYSFMEKNQLLIIKFADTILMHKLDFLGTGFIELDKKSHFKSIVNSNLNNSKKILKMLDGNYILIDWHKDFKTNYIWDNKKWFKFIKFGANNSDIKIPWELGRIQYLMILAYSYKLTKKAKYGIEFRNQCLDFIGQNPPRFGVQWKSPMDVGIRATNMLISYQIFKDNGFTFDDEFIKEFTNYNYLSGKFIFENPEWSGGQRGNHFLCNICSLIIISQFFNNNECGNWFKFAINNLEKEILYQFGEDGGNFEASLSYHYFALEMILSALYFLKLNDLKSYNIFINNSPIIERLSKILDFSVVNLIKDYQKNYITPQIGDNDSGFFLSLFPIIKENNHSYETINKNNLFLLIEELFNDLGVGKSDLSLKQMESNKFLVYQNFGITIFKNELFHFTIRCGSVGQNGKGGHAHNDQLSITLAVAGREIFVDSGTFVYTSNPELRNKFRSTNLHNTLILDGQEQNDLGNEIDDLFWLNDKSKAKMMDISNDEFSGLHVGYNKPHKRTIKIADNSIYGKDILELDILKTIKFHIHHNCQVELLNSNSVLIKIDKIEVILMSNGAKITIEESLYSPEYGILQKNKVIILESVNFEVRWEIRIDKFE